MAGLSKETVAALPFLFELWALTHQRPPEGDWNTWIILGGRGAGKTRAGAEWVRSLVEGDTPQAPGTHKRVALIGETIDQVREVMVRGESGILNCSPDDRRPVWEASRNSLVWKNGAQAMAFSASNPEALRGPQFDAAWCDEYGCPAIDKGANQPNVFFDPKSSESALPYYSDGTADPFMQAQYLRAIHGYWEETKHNPLSDVYFGPMVDLANSHVWAWDSRPWPEFPSKLSVWSDGTNHALGHWITGRFHEQLLASVVSEICDTAGLHDIDVSELFGMTTGVAIASVETGRQTIQPLMLAYDFTAHEDGEKLVFRNREESVSYSVMEADLVKLKDAAAVSKTRTPEAESVGRVRVAFWDDLRDYQAGASEYRLSDDDSESSSQIDLPIVMQPGRAENIAARSLVRARVARDELKIALPPSVPQVVVGDVIKLADGGTDATYCVERIEEQAARLIEAHRIEQHTYKEKDVRDIPKVESVLTPSRAPHLRFLDLPTLSEDQTSTAPFVAATSSPWAAPVAINSSISDDGYRFNRLIERRSQLGKTVNALPKAPIGVWDNRALLSVKISSGVLQSRSELDVLAGENVVAIGAGGPAGWEIFQFRDALLQTDGTYVLNGLLRGQLGSDTEMPAVWPVGSDLVFLDQSIAQIDISDAQRGLQRYYRFGPADKPLSDDTYRTEVHAFDMIALRPLSPVHLSVETDVEGLRLFWIRRTRIDGDSWAGMDVPLGESSESYVVRVRTVGGSLLRETLVSEPVWTYNSIDIAADGATGALKFEVAQVSEKFGAGAWASIDAVV